MKRPGITFVCLKWQQDAPLIVDLPDGTIQQPIRLRDDMVESIRLLRFVNECDFES